MGKGSLTYIVKEGKANLQDLLKIAFPLIIQGLVFQLQSLTDKAFLGHLDTKFVSAVGAAQAPYISTVDSLAAVNTGLIIIIARLYGAKDNKRIPAYVKSTALYGSIAGLLLFVLWEFFTTPVLQIFQIDSQIIQYSIVYVRICAWYLLLLGIDTAFQAMLQGIGQTRPIMYAGLLKVGLNILISWVLIFGKLGFPALYVEGAAIGTLVANLVSFTFLVIYCFFGKEKKVNIFSKGLEWRKFCYYKEVIKLGIPVGMEYLLWNSSNLVLIRFINGFSYKDMAIYTMTFSLQCVVFMLFEGFCKAAMTRIGQCVGSGERKKADQYFYTCMGTNAVIVSIANVIFWLIPVALLEIFSTDTEIILRGVPYLKMIGIIMFGQSMNIICGNAIRAYGNTRWMLLSQILGSTFVVCFSWVLIGIFHFDMMAVYWTLFLDEAIRGSINFVYYRRKYSVKA